MPLVATVHWSVQSLWPLLLLPVALALAWLGYHNTTPPLPAPARRGFVGLRTLSFFLLLVVLASPILDRVRNEPKPPRWALVVDESASMSIVDAAPSGPTRAERARAAIRELAGAAGDDDVALEVVPFAVQAELSLRPEAYLEHERAASGGVTDILGALRTTTDRLAVENLQALVLVSDGRTTHGRLDASSLAGLGRPVFVVGLGDTLRAADLAIDRCDYAPIAYVESEAPLQVRVENSGFRGKTVPLRLLEGEREIFRRDLRFEQEQGRTQVEIPLALSEPGRKSLRLVLEPQPGEQSERNNVREIRIEVLKNRLRVLFLAAQPDWDVAFLARTLRADPSVDLTLVHRNEKSNWIRSDSGTGFVFPQGERAILEYDLFILGSPGQGSPAAFWTGIVQAVERGRGLLLLAGRESVYTTADVFTALSAALPVQRQARQPVRYTVLRPRLTPQGRLHPVTAPLSELADATDLLAPLPPLLARHAEVQAKPGALTLLVSEAPDPTPVLVVGRYGGGHTAAWGAFPHWRWGMSEVAERRRAMTDFVSHLVRWLTQPKDVKRVQITSAKPVYQGGEPVDFTAQVLDPQLQPVPDAEVRIEVRHSAGAHETAATLLLERRPGKPGEYEGRLTGLGPGEYAAEAVANWQGSEAGRDTTEVTVETYSIEFANSSQDVDFLREVAAQTGGRYATPAEVGALARELPRNPQPVLLHSEIEVWNSAWLFMAFVVLLGTEWLLRKRRGML